MGMFIQVKPHKELVLIRRIPGAIINNRLTYSKLVVAQITNGHDELCMQIAVYKYDDHFEAVFEGHSKMVIWFTDIERGGELIKC